MSYSSYPYSSSDAHYHIALLASSETQLIMQMLNQQSLLLVARCNRRLRTDASCEFAWKDQSFVCSIDKNDPSQPSVFSPSLARFVSVKWRNVDWPPISPTAAEVSALLSFRRISMLTLDRKAITDAQWNELFAHSVHYSTLVNCSSECSI